MKQKIAAAKPWELLLFTASFLVLIFLCFYRLDSGAILGFDEGRHGVNALEMYRNGEPLVNTYRGETDYFNLKPPLSMYLIMTGYRLFGIGSLGLRFFSAVCYLLTALLASSYVWKKSDALSASFCMLLFAGSKLFLLNSMARNGDANAVYNLFFMIAMLSLLKLTAQKKQGLTNCLSACCGIGIGFSMAFLSKSYHAMMILIIVFFTMLWEKCLVKLHAKEWSLMALCGFLPPAVWAVLRFQRDGFHFLSEMLLTDVFRRTKVSIAGKNGGPFYYFVSLVEEDTTLSVLFLLLLVFLIAFYCGEKPEKQEKGLYVMVILPLILFSIPKTKVITYIYPSIMGLYIWGSLAFYTLRRKMQLSLSIRCIRIAGLLLAAVLPLYGLVGIVKTESNEQPNPFELMVTNKPALFEGSCNIYSTFQNPYMDNAWFQDEVLNIEMYTDLHCVDGGHEGFRSEQGEAYLVIDKILGTLPADFALEPAEQVIFEDEWYLIVKKTAAH